MHWFFDKGCATRSLYFKALKKYIWTDLHDFSKIHTVGQIWVCIPGCLPSLERLLVDTDSSFHWQVETSWGSAIKNVIMERFQLASLEHWHSRHNAEGTRTSQSYCFANSKGSCDSGGSGEIIYLKSHQDFAISESLLGRNLRLGYACVIVCYVAVSQTVSSTVL